MEMKWKGLVLIGMIMANTISVTAYAGEKEKESAKTIEQNRLANRKEYKDMKKTMTRIQQDKERILFHKEALKKNRDAKLKIESHMSKKELKKAKADLRRDKKYLCIDKKDLESDQWVAIQQANHEKRWAKKELRQAKRDVRKDLRKEDAAAFKADSLRVAALYDIREREKLENVALKEEVFEFFALLDEEIAQTV